MSWRSPRSKSRLPTPRPHVPRARSRRGQPPAGGRARRRLPARVAVRTVIGPALASGLQLTARPDADDTRITFHVPVALEAVGQVIEAGAGNAHGAAPRGCYPPLHSGDQRAGQLGLEIICRFRTSRPDAATRSHSRTTRASRSMPPVNRTAGVGPGRSGFSPSEHVHRVANAADRGAHGYLLTCCWMVSSGRCTDLRPCLAQWRAATGVRRHRARAGPLPMSPVTSSAICGRLRRWRTGATWSMRLPIRDLLRAVILLRRGASRGLT